MTKDQRIAVLERAIDSMAIHLEDMGYCKNSSCKKAWNRTWTKRGCIGCSRKYFISIAERELRRKK